MTTHVDMLDQPERLSRPFWMSMILHLSLGVAVLSSAWIRSIIEPVQWGDPHGGGIGSVSVTPVNSIKLPSEAGPQNPVANDTQSQVPEPPAKKKPVEKVKAPDPNAIALKDPKSNSKKKPVEKAQASTPNKFRESQQDVPNQLYTSGGQKLNSPLFNMQGGGGLQIGNDSVFGTQFGAYATLMRNKISEKWITTGFDTRVNVPPAIVSFIIRRDGSLAPGSLKLTQRSGNSALDISAQRAIEDAAPFLPLPREFPRSEAQVELRFNLK